MKYFSWTAPGILSLDLQTDVWTRRTDLMDSKPSHITPGMFVPKIPFAHLTEGGQNKIVLFGGSLKIYQPSSEVTMFYLTLHINAKMKHFQVNVFDFETESWSQLEGIPISTYGPYLEAELTILVQND